MHLLKWCSWRDFGILWAYLIVNIVGACSFYWYFRVPKHAGKEPVSSLDEKDSPLEMSGWSTSTGLDAANIVVKERKSLAP